MSRFVPLLLIGIAFCYGCSTGSGSAKKVCYPVKGQLLVQGKPAEGALLILQPKDNPDAAGWATGFPHATTVADGKFELGTYADVDGAPAGDYIVLVSWTKPNPQNEEASTPTASAAAIPIRSTSKLTAKVEARPTELPPINLQ